MARSNVRFGEAVAEAMGSMTYREAGALADLDPATILKMRRGRLVKRETIEAFADGLRVSNVLRRALFLEAGLIPDFTPVRATGRELEPSR